MSKGRTLRSLPSGRRVSKDRVVTLILKSCLKLKTMNLLSPGKSLFPAILNNQKNLAALNLNSLLV